MGDELIARQGKKSNWQKLGGEKCLKLKFKKKFRGLRNDDDV